MTEGVSKKYLQNLMAVSFLVHIFLLAFYSLFMTCFRMTKQLKRGPLKDLEPGHDFEVVVEDDDEIFIRHNEAIAEEVRNLML